jgi:hypothetical protein
MDTLWGLRLYDVLVRVTTWAGGTDAYANVAGAQGGTATHVDTALTVNGARLKVEQLTQKDIIASGGLYQDQDIKIGPLTPYDASAYPAGIDPSTFDPAPNSNMTVLFQVTGPAYPTGAWFQKVGMELLNSNFHYYLVLRKTGQQGN